MSTSPAIASDHSKTTDPKPTLFTPAFIAVAAITFGAMTSFYLLAATVPAYVSDRIGGTTIAGASTGALMLGTIVAELSMRRLARCFSCRTLIRAGLVLLGVPALLLALVPGNVVSVLVGCAARGVGFGTLMVSTGVVLAEIVPAHRRGEGFGLYGIIVGIPSIVALPMGPWLAGHFGYTAVFLIAGCSAVSGIGCASGLRVSVDHRTESRAPSIPSTVRNGNLLPPLAAFAATAVAVGAAITFLPIALSRSATTVMLALTAQAVTSTVTRWAAGRVGDRYGHTKLLAPGVAVAALGTAGLAISDQQSVVVAAMLVFGTGFGVALSASMAIMLDRVTPIEYPAVSALWNLTYDGGWGLGALAFGVVTSKISYQAGFALTAAAMLIPLVSGRSGRRAAEAAVTPPRTGPRTAACVG